MHQCVPVFCVTTCYDIQLVHDVMEVFCTLLSCVRCTSYVTQEYKPRPLPSLVSYFDYCLTFLRNCSELLISQYV